MIFFLGIYHYYAMTNHAPIKTIGSRIEVFHGKAHHTSGGLTKKDLKKNRFGRIVSKKASLESKKRFYANPALQKKFKEAQNKYAYSS